MSIFDRRDMRDLFEQHKKDGMTRKTGLAECYTWHNVCIAFMSGYPFDYVAVEINGKPASNYFNIKVDDGMPLSEADNIFWDTPEYVEKAERLFLGEE